MSASATQGGHNNKYCIIKQAPDRYQIISPNTDVLKYGIQINKQVKEVQRTEANARSGAALY